MANLKFTDCIPISIIRRCKYHNQESSELYNKVHLSIGETDTLLCGKTLNYMWYIVDFLITTKENLVSDCIHLATCSKCKSVLKSLEKNCQV